MFLDRKDAGRRLAEAPACRRGEERFRVLAISRGAVRLGYEAGLVGGREISQIMRRWRTEWGR